MNIDKKTIPDLRIFNTQKIKKQKNKNILYARISSLLTSVFFCVSCPLELQAMEDDEPHSVFYSNQQTQHQIEEYYDENDNLDFDFNMLENSQATYTEHLPFFDANELFPELLADSPCLLSQGCFEEWEHQIVDPHNATRENNNASEPPQIMRPQLTQQQLNGELNKPTVKRVQPSPYATDDEIVSVQRFGIAVAQEEEKQHDLAIFNYYLAYGSLPSYNDSSPNLVKKCIRIGGKGVWIQIQKEFWKALDRIAHKDVISLGELIGQIIRHRCSGTRPIKRPEAIGAFILERLLRAKPQIKQQPVSNEHIDIRGLKQEYRCALQKIAAADGVSAKALASIIMRDLQDKRSPAIRARSMILNRLLRGF